jgi:hypothetical protein
MGLMDFSIGKKPSMLPLNTADTLPKEPAKRHQPDGGSDGFAPPASISAA